MRTSGVSGLLDTSDKFFVPDPSDKIVLLIPDPLAIITDSRIRSMALRQQHPCCCALTSLLSTNTSRSHQDNSSLMFLHVRAQYDSLPTFEVHPTRFLVWPSSYSLFSCSVEDGSHPQKGHCPSLSWRPDLSGTLQAALLELSSGGTLYDRILSSTHCLMKVRNTVLSVHWLHVCDAFYTAKYVERRRRFSGATGGNASTSWRHVTRKYDTR